MEFFRAKCNNNFQLNSKVELTIKTKRSSKYNRESKSSASGHTMISESKSKGMFKQNG